MRPLMGVSPWTISQSTCTALTVGEYPLMDGCMQEEFVACRRLVGSAGITMHCRILTAEADPQCSITIEETMAAARILQKWFASMRQSQPANLLSLQA